MDKMTFKQQFTTFVQAGFPLMLVQTAEVDRATESIRKLAGAWNKALAGMKHVPANIEYLKASGYKLMIWDCVNGWHSLDSEGNRVSQVAETGGTPHKGLEWLVSDKAKAGFYIMQNAHMFFSDTAILPDGNPSFPKLIQLFRHQYESKSLSKHLFLVGNSTEVPSELRPLSVVMDFTLPTSDELETFITKYVRDTLGAKDVPDESIAEAATAAAGLTTHEVESAICVAIVSSAGKEIDRQIVFNEKVQAVKRSGLLEYMPVSETIDDIGGYEIYKDWLKKMSKAFLEPEKAKSYGRRGLPVPRGVSVAGVSGCGKTLSAKVAASLFEVPLYRMDIGKLMGSLVGSTESKTRDALQLVVAVSPSVILIDEAEKSLSGAGSGAQDTGVSDRLLGSILTFMQEKTVPAFFVFTANNATRLPMELTRKGRVDECFFVDLPNEIERAEILRIHLTRQAPSMKAFSGFERLAGKETEGFTGAEIEAVIGQAMYVAFNEDRMFNLKDVELALSQTIPLAKSRQEEIRALRNWARGRAVLASRGDLVNVSNLPSKPKASTFWGIMEEDDDNGSKKEKDGRKRTAKV